MFVLSDSTEPGSVESCRTYHFYLQFKTVFVKLEELDMTSKSYVNCHDPILTVHIFTTEVEAFIISVRCYLIRKSAII